jgi:hypothetical protein
MRTPMYCYAVDRLMSFYFVLRKTNIIAEGFPPKDNFYRYKLCTVLDRYKYPIDKVE